MRRALAAAALALAVAVPGAPRAASPGEYDVQAALAFNFLKFVTWPEARAGAPTLRACALASPPFAAAMGALRGRPVGGRALEVVEIGAVADAASCDAVFLGEQGPRPEELAAAVASRGVLTLSDTDGYAARGVAINFYVERGQVRFEANPAAIRASGLQVSSQVLRLARVVSP